jgi:hypothetical protein
MLQTHTQNMRYLLFFDNNSLKERASLLQVRCPFIFYFAREISFECSFGDFTLVVLDGPH